MNDLNQCQFIGRLGKDIELRYSADGKAIANFTIAVGEAWKSKQSGQKQEKTTWVPIVIFGKLAEIAGEYLKKGSRIYVSGKFQVRKWQNQEGQDQYSTEVIVDGFSGTMQMLDSRGDDKPAGQPAPQQAQQAPASQQAPAGQPFEDEFDDDIPF